MLNTIFPTGDLTMISISVYDKAQDLKVLVEEIKKVEFSQKSETIANIMLAVRHLEDAEYRISKAKECIIESSK